MDYVFSGIAVFGSLLLVYIVLPILRTHIGKKELEIAKEVITNIVASLEMSEISGKEKKELAISMIKRILKLKKINIPSILIDALIESSLYFLRKKYGKKKKEKELSGDAILEYSVKEGY